MSRKRKSGPTPKRQTWDPLVRAAPSDPQKFIDAGISVPARTYVNDLYSVFVREIGHGALHVSFHRHDRAAVRDWRHFQAIKNEVAGPERTAIEIFPPESQLIDQANEYHLWVLPHGFPLPFVLDAGRLATTQAENEAKHGPSKARQRDWQPGLPTGPNLGDDYLVDRSVPVDAYEPIADRR